MPLRQQVEEMPTVNLTSMIDVLFLLIIFFVVGTKFIEAERQIELELPRVSRNDALSAAPEKKVVNVYRDGQITLDRQDVTLEQLSAQLAAAREQYHGLGVLVRGDGVAPFERVANVLNACKLAGIGDLSISVEIAEAGSGNARR
ncbi:MAG: biopolymer transporter ExbD [Planctomycetota bacterium]|nr:MAG: biopolymer transporter ExbD [Planctomycetota bacterium]